MAWEDPTGMSTPVMIEADGLCKQFGSFLAVRDVSFTIPKGQVVAFLGPNGAGKTTTMRLLTGFVAPTHGIGPDRRDRRPGRSDQRRRTPRLSARERTALPRHDPDVAAPVLRRGAGTVRGQAAQAAVDAVITQCALDSVAHKPIGKLSKGYRQRVSMAQALLHDPEVLIMDEPTSGLDPNQIRGVRS